MTNNDYIKVAYTLTFTTPFHCGTGLRQGLIDRTIVRDHDGYVYVPGSTLKGIIREQCERLARFYEVLDQDMYDLIASPHDDTRSLWSRGYSHTLITRIFGSPAVPGLLFFDDAYQDDEAKRVYDSKERGFQGQGGGRGKYKDVQIDLSTQVRIDRPTRTAMRAALYTSELGIKDLTFTGTISGWLKCIAIEDIESRPSYSLLLLLAGLHLLDRVGGNKSTGKGQCQCKITGVTRGKTLYKEEQWRLWLDRLDALSYYSSSSNVQEDKA